MFETSITGSTATRCAVIAITDDDILESSEFFTVTVSSVIPSIVIGDMSQSVEIQINDTDGKNWCDYARTSTCLTCLLLQLSFVS